MKNIVLSRMSIATRAIAGALVLAVSACSSDDGKTQDGDPGISITLSPTSASIAQGSSAQVTATVTRSGGYNGAARITVEGIPNGVTGDIVTSPTNNGVTIATITIGATTTIAAGTYNLTVRVEGDDVDDDVATFALTVTSATPTTGNVTLDFSSCISSSQPVWLAAQDGSGGYTRVIPSGAVYRFNVTAATGSYAWVTRASNGATVVRVVTRSRDALTGTPLVPCSAVGAKNLTGSVTNLPSSAVARVSMGGDNVAGTSNGSFQFVGLPEGPLDLIAFAHVDNATGAGDRVVIRRSISQASGSTLAAIDFNGAEVFAPATATMSMTGVAAGEDIEQAMWYYTGINANACQPAILYDVQPPSTTFTAFGIPSTRQDGTDFHELNVLAGDATSYRLATRSFHTMSAQAIALPAVIPATPITTLLGPYRRLQTTFVLPAEYNGVAQLTYGPSGSGVSHLAVVTRYTESLAGQSITLAMPDLSTVPGWDNSWAPSASLGGAFQVDIASPNTSPCVEGARFVAADRAGTY